MVRSWEEIRETYQGFVESGLELKPMLKLVESIQKSPYADGLYAWTSMHDLCIVQSPVTYPYDGPYLRISPQFNGKVEFRYIDTHVESKQWHRTESEDELFPRLEGFINQLHWFVKERTVNDS